jgi:hypothetical protein
MEQSSQEADNHLSDQEIPCLLGKPKVRYHIQKGLPLVPILSHFASVHNLTPCFFQD